jgi:tetraacyldisaccharide 4'-kinase
VAVVDAARGLGNRRCLPAGPLREPPGRLASVDWVLTNGVPRTGPGFDLRPGDAISLSDPAVRRPLGDFRGAPVTAVAGIGNPERFFAMLRGLGLSVQPRPYPDHHGFTAADVALWGPGPVLMTEKDAVKCVTFARSGHWAVPVEAELDAGFSDALFARLRGH